jgi:hypothetical protein
LDCVPGPDHDVIVQAIRFPETEEEAGEVGVDIDGDGLVDNRLGAIHAWFVDQGIAVTANDVAGTTLASGEVVLLGRVRGAGNSYFGAVARLILGETIDASPLFDGSDRMGVHPDNVRGVLWCGLWEPPRLETYPNTFLLPLPLSLPNAGVAWVMLTPAQMRTVEEPQSPYFGDSAVTEAGWTNVMVGGGVSHDELTYNLLPLLAQVLSARVSRDATSAESVALVDLFDGRCDATLPQCEDTVAGEGPCDASAVPPEITATELWCNAALRPLITPDVDSDGDGQKDVLSVGFRIVRAVPVTIIE